MFYCFNTFVSVLGQLNCKCCCLTCPVHSSLSLLLYCVFSTNEDDDDDDDVDRRTCCQLSSTVESLSYYRIVFRIVFIRHKLIHSIHKYNETPQGKTTRQMCT